MSSVTVIIEEKEDGEISARVDFDPPIMPGVELSRVQRIAVSAFRGSKIEGAIEQVLRATGHAG